MGTCRACGRSGATVSDALGVCVDCLRDDPGAVEIALEAHRGWRSAAGLPPDPPRDPEGARCGLCAADCLIPPGGRGYCGVVLNDGGTLRRPTGGWDVAPGLWYYDPHPTNCVSAPFCPGATCRGYPEYTNECGPELGKVNLAVFYGGCGLDCLFCQNWEHKVMAASPHPGRTVSVGELAEAGSDPRVTCVCFFGGDPGPFGPHSLAAARRLSELARRSGRRIRLCWETNGTVHPGVARAWMRLALESGGNVKIDLKAWSPPVYRALTGVDSRDRALENLREMARISRGKTDPPPLVASLLLVPGYVDEVEVAGLAEEIARIDPSIPLVLLAFRPDFLLRDLPTTSMDHARRAVEAARAAGLEEIRVGNEWLLGDAY